MGEFSLLFVAGRLDLVAGFLRRGFVPRQYADLKFGNCGRDVLDQGHWRAWSGARPVSHAVTFTLIVQ